MRPYSLHHHHHTNVLVWSAVLGWAGLHGLHGDTDTHMTSSELGHFKHHHTTPHHHHHHHHHTTPCVQKLTLTTAEASPENLELAGQPACRSHGVECSHQKQTTTRGKFLAWLRQGAGGGFTPGRHPTCRIRGSLTTSWKYLFPRLQSWLGGL